MEILAIVPARGGSKGIPRKNLRRVGGRPLVARSIATARRSQRVTRVAVSTDDPEIAAVARESGAEVIERPPELGGDSTSSEAVLLHALDRLRETEAYEPELLVLLQCTSPLTLPEDVDGAIETLLREEADSVFTAAPFFHFLWQEGDGGQAVGINHDAAVRPMRQQRAGQSLETGAVYVMRTAGFRRHRHRFFGSTRIHLTPVDRAHEIDEPRDLAVAEALVAERRRAARGARLPASPGALVLDFDGVLTDNRVLVFEDGREAVLCDRGDGLGVERLGRQPIALLVLSRETNPVVAARCRKLGIDCLQGVRDKVPALAQWLRERGVAPERTIFVGNDVNDLECMRFVGCAVAVADAYPEVRAAARLVLSRPGGRGAVRELTDLILDRKGSQDHG